MKFFQPIIQLAREDVFDAPSEYFLHVVTFCPRTSFRADGYETDDSELDNDTFIVQIKISQDPGLPEMEYITPVVHTISLGGIAFPRGEGVIRVEVVGDVLPQNPDGTRAVDEPAETKSGGSGTMGTTDADNKTKPIDSGSLFSMY